MYEDLLEETGLTKNEAIIYMTLLKTGKSKSGELIKKSKVSSGKIYETLYKLIDKGLVKSVSENGVQHFIANNPKAVISYIQEKEKLLQDKEEKLKKILPELESVAKIETNLETVSLIKGFRGISPIIYEHLEKANTTINIMGLRSSKNVKFNNFWKNWHRHRVELKKEAQLLFSDKNTEYWKFFKKLEYTEVHETLSTSPSAIAIINENVFIFSYDEEFTCIHINSSSIANSFKSFFESLWSYQK